MHLRVLICLIDRCRDEDWFNFDAVASIAFHFLAIYDHWELADPSLVSVKIFVSVAEISHLLCGGRRLSWNWKTMQADKIRCSQDQVQTFSDGRLGVKQHFNERKEEVSDFVSSCSLVSLRGRLVSFQRSDSLSLSLSHSLSLSQASNPAISCCPSLFSTKY